MAGGGTGADADRSATEVEAKFRVHPPFQVPDLTGEHTGVAAVGPPVVRELRAVYWDTADLRLAREGITLRYRSGEGANDGWHLKLPVQEAAVPDTSTGVREELHAAGEEDAVPEQLHDLVSVHVRGAVLGPVATLLTTRTTYRLCGADGNARAELTDDLVSVLNQGHVAGRFREIEVESADGDHEVLRAVGNVLRSAGAVSGAFVPKVVRALGPKATADPDPPPPSPVDVRAPARLAVQAVLRRYVRIFMAQDPRVRRGEEDSVHQMRVAARRLRSALKTFRPLVDEAWAKSLRDELAWVADALGGARDGEVLLARLQHSLDQLPPELVLGTARARLEAQVGGDLVAAQARAVETLRTERYLALVDRLVDAAWEPMTTQLAEAPAATAIPGCVGSAWRRLARAAARVKRTDATDHDWHVARISAKQVRYAAEAAVPFFGKPAKRLAVKAEEIQELLGEHQDAVVAAGTVRRLATGPRAGSAAFTFGLLYAREMDAIADTRQKFPRLWAEASRPAYRKWLRG
jgi:CHAD domain-containing protein